MPVCCLRWEHGSVVDAGYMATLARAPDVCRTQGHILERTWKISLWPADHSGPPPVQAAAAAALTRPIFIIACLLQLKLLAASSDTGLLNDIKDLETLTTAYHSQFVQGQRTLWWRIARFSDFTICQTTVCFSEDLLKLPWLFEEKKRGGGCFCFVLFWMLFSLAWSKVLRLNDNNCFLMHCGRNSGGWDSLASRHEEHRHASETTHSLKDLLVPVLKQLLIPLPGVGNPLLLDTGHPVVLLCCHSMTSHLLNNCAGYCFLLCFSLETVEQFNFRQMLLFAFFCFPSALMIRCWINVPGRSVSVFTSGWQNDTWLRFC